MPEEANEVSKDIRNTIIRTEKSPDVWKNGIFIPIFKKGDLNEYKNYRIITAQRTEKIICKNNGRKKNWKEN